MNKNRACYCLWVASAACALAFTGLTHAGQTPAPFRLATFRADVTIPLNHRCMGVLPTKSKRIVDPLFAHGFVLLGSETPIVFVAVDWCEIRNGAYEQWRNVLAETAGTSPKRVLVCSVHQHDAPVIDTGAAKLLVQVGLKNELFDEAFHEKTLRRVAAALKASLQHTLPITHVGLGQAKVERIASNRRVVHSDGKVRFDRGSRSGGDAFFRDAPVGTIDPYLKTISLWNEKKPLLALHCYSTHPMSYYGQGGVSWDFVGMARQHRQEDDPSVHQIYATGCSGDTTAGKYNDGSPENRGRLADRLYRAMVDAWQTRRLEPLRTIQFRSTTLDLEFHPAERLSKAALQRTLRDSNRPVEPRILAAMGLSSRARVAASKPIDMPCIDFGCAQLVLLPGESFVHYQLMAQRIRPDSFVMAIGFGECWPGYIPTDQNFKEGFTDKWLWVAPGSEARMGAALHRVLDR